MAAPTPTWMTPTTTRAIAGIAAVLLVVESITRDTKLVRLLGGFVLLFAAGALARTVARRLVFAVPGASLVASAVGPRLHQRWAAPLTAAVIVAAATTVPELERHLERGVVWLLMLTTIGGIYACIPETGHLRALAITVGLMALIEAWSGERLGAGPLAAAAGVLAWSVAYGGTYRDSALVGGFASFGVLLLAPVAQQLRTRMRSGARQLGTVSYSAALVTVHAIAAAVVSRTAGLATTIGVAIDRAIPTVATLAGVVAVLETARANGTRTPGNA